MNEDSELTKEEYTKIVDLYDTIDMMCEDFPAAVIPRESTEPAFIIWNKRVRISKFAREKLISQGIVPPLDMC